MWKSVSAGLGALLLVSVCRGSGLTEVETRWLKGVGPVIAFARDAKLPLDVIVQPQPNPGSAPVAMAFIDGPTLDRIGAPLAHASIFVAASALWNSVISLED